MAVVVWFGHKVFDHLLDDLLGKAMEPWMHYIYEYAISITLVLIAPWILWPELIRAEKNEKGSPPKPETLVALVPPEFVSMDAAARPTYTEARRVQSFWAESVEVAAKDYSGKLAPDRLMPLAGWVNGNAVYDPLLATIPAHHPDTNNY